MSNRKIRIRDSQVILSGILSNNLKFKPKISPSSKAGCIQLTIEGQRPTGLFYVERSNSQGPLQGAHTISWILTKRVIENLIKDTTMHEAIEKLTGAFYRNLLITFTICKDRIFSETEHLNRLIGELYFSRERLKVSRSESEMKKFITIAILLLQLLPYSADFDATPGNGEGKAMKELIACEERLKEGNISSDDKREIYENLSRLFDGEAIFMQCCGFNNFAYRQPSVSRNENESDWITAYQLMGYFRFIQAFPYVSHRMLSPYESPNVERLDIDSFVVNWCNENFLNNLVKMMFTLESSSYSTFIPLGVLREKVKTALMMIEALKQTYENA